VKVKKVNIAATYELGSFLSSMSPFLDVIRCSKYTTNLQVPEEEGEDETNANAHDPSHL
jgi:hypothetical protein